MSKSKKTPINTFQEKLLRNLTSGGGILRHCGSAPVQDLLEKGLLEKTDSEAGVIYIPTAEAVKLLD